MRTETIKIYGFEELSPEAQERAISDVADDSYYLGYDWWDFLHEGFHEELEKIGIKCKDFHWDFDRNNYFEMEKPYAEDLNKFLESAGFKKQNLMLALDGRDATTDIGLSFHERKLYIDYYDSGSEDDVKYLRELYGNEEDLAEKLNDYLQNILYGFLKQLRDEYDYLCSEEYIRCYLTDGDYEFTEDGKKI
jgi:hypothetical protein